jgi:hypothetical protein
LLGLFNAGAGAARGRDRSALLQQLIYQRKANTSGAARYQGVGLVPVHAFSFLWLVVRIGLKA